MRKSICIASAASLALAAMPIVGAFAGTSSVTDEIQVTIPDSCTLTSSTTNTENGETSTTNTYTATMSNGQVKSDIGSTGASTAGSNVLSINCNTSDATKNTWKLTAIGGNGTTVDTTMKAGVTSNPAIATGTGTDGANSQWAMKVVGNGVTIQNDFDEWHVVPGTALEVASGSGTVTNAFTMTYQVYISQTQPSDTYTGRVTYTLTNPNN